MVHREELAYVTCTYRGTSFNEPDFLVTVDLDPKSPNYGQVIHRLPMPNLNDRLRSSGFGTAHRNINNRLILPSLTSSRTYVVDVGSNRRAPSILQMIELGDIELTWNRDRGFLNVPRSLPTGDVLIANMGDPAGNGKSGLIMLEKDTFDLKGNWEHDAHRSVYDFWIQPRHNVLVSSAGFIPEFPGRGFDLNNIGTGVFGRHLDVWNLSNHTLLQTFDLGEDSLPLSVRFLHNPDAAEGYVGCALSGVVYRIFKREGESWAVEEVIHIPSTNKMPAFITDIVISMDDKFLYLCNWLHGDVHQYKLSKNSKPQLVGQCKLEDGGPAQMQLSLDGKRLYVTNSFYSTWDKQFYPEMVREGSAMLLIDVDTEKGGLTVNKNFRVNFGKEPNGPCLAHAIHFPSGDSTTENYD